MQTLPVNGYDMAYLEVGDSGPPLVCVHGSLCDFRIWSSVLGPLSRKHRVIAPSLRHFFPEHWDGVGDTYSIAQHVDDVIGFIEKLDAGPVDLMGHSRGGHICVSRRAAAAGFAAQADPGRARRRTRRHARSRLQARPLAAGGADRGLRRGDRQGRHRRRAADLHGCAGRSRRLEAPAGDAEATAARQRHHADRPDRATSARRSPRRMPRRSRRRRCSSAAPTPRARCRRCCTRWRRMCRDRAPR